MWARDWKYFALVPLCIFAVIGVFGGASKALGKTPVYGWGTGEQVISPMRPLMGHLTDFSLCELDKRTLETRGPCIPAKVPGDIFTALMAAGKIPDPYRDFNSRLAQWVDDRAWRYETTFYTSPKPGKRLHLLFMGVDYISKIELNGKVLVARHEGMFSRLDLDITDALNPSGGQKLSVTLFGIPGSNTDWLGPMLGSSEFGRRHYLKTQMSFGWDFAPRLKGAGLWDQVVLYETGPVRIQDIYVKPHLDGRLEIQVETPTIVEDTELEIMVVGETFLDEPVRKTVKLAAGAPAATTIELTVPSPHLWWPWDMGTPDLYRVHVTARVKGEVSDEAAEIFGFREIKWGPNPDAPEGAADWVLFINGKREFMRGANWVPPEAMYGRMDDSRYQKLVGMAKAVGVNMLRVWGGGNRERRAFYDDCDRAGIMVWQEFPFACVYLVGYPPGRAFADLTRREVAEIVRQLRNHPGLIMWCGGNEFNVAKAQKLVDIMAEITGALDPTRRFIPASPYRGDSHNWVVWHMKGNLSDYFADISPLPSEFGLQAFPDVKTIEQWISPELRWPLGDVYVHHDLGTAKMMKYLAALPKTDNLADMVAASQLMQSHYLQRGIEHWRQRKYKTSGTAFWQFNEPWPAVCWSVVDYELRPKAAYIQLKDTYNPLLVSVAYADQAWAPGQNFVAEIIVVNDLHSAFPAAMVSANLCGAEAGKWTLDVPEDDVARPGKISAPIPPDCARPSLTLSLVHAGQEISHNHYELWVYDPAPAGGLNRRLEIIGKWIMSGARQTQWEEPKKVDSR